MCPVITPDLPPNKLQNYNHIKHLRSAVTSLVTGTLEDFHPPDHPSSEENRVLLGIGDDLLFIQEAVFVAVVAFEFGIDALHDLLRGLLLVRHFAAVGALHQNGILP